MLFSPLPPLGRGGSGGEGVASGLEMRLSGRLANPSPPTPSPQRGEGRTFPAPRLPMRHGP